MKKTAMFAAFIVAGLTARSQVVPNFDWIQNYSQQDSREDTSSAIDGEDNVIVCGYTFVSGNDNMLILKYDNLGNLLWTAQYNNGGNDRAIAVTTDSADNVYVTGQSVGTGTGIDYATIKYNSSGTQQWVARYNGSANQGDIPRAIAVDSLGNIYVTGTSKSVTGFDYLTVKYDSSGTQLWEYRYDGASSGDDGAHVLKIDYSGNLFVTGKATTATGLDIVTLKINPSTGANIWTNTANGSANLGDQPYDMVLDNGNPVVAGMVNNTSTNEDYFVRKINGTSGVTVWTYTHDCYGQNDHSSSIDMTTDHYFLLTGIGKTSSGAVEYHTVKLDNSGSQQWVNIEATGVSGTQDVNPRLVRDFVDHMYVTGQKNAANSDIYVYQITPGGNKTWSKTHKGSAGGLDVGVDFLVNSLGQLYLVGQTRNASSGFDFTTIKISQTPVAFVPDSEAVGNVKFFPNLGQLYDTDDSLVTDIEYYNNAKYPNTYIKKNCLSYVLYHADTTTGVDDTAQRIDMTIAQTNGLTEIYNFEQNDPSYHYFFGDLSAGITSVKSSNRLLIPNIYPGIDLHYYSSATGLKMYWVIKPWANPTDIQLTFSGQSSINLSSGKLHINSLLESIVWDDPQYFQIDTAFSTSPTGYTIIPVSGGAYTLGGSTVSFNSPTYNPLLPLIIQVDNGDAPPPPASTPIDNLYWSTFVGHTGEEKYEDMRTDNNEDILVCGYSKSMNFPTTPGALVGINLTGSYKGVFAKYSHVNGELEYASYLGEAGSGDNVFARGIDADDSGNIYIVGQTSGAPFTSFPNVTLGNYQKTTASWADAYVIRFNPLTAQIEYFTYFGGSNNENPYDLRIDRHTGFKRILLGGITLSTDLVLTAPPAGYQANSGLGFILVLSLTGDTLYSSYFPGVPKAFASDNGGSYCVFGDISTAHAANLPIAQSVVGQYVDSTYNGSDDVFLTRFAFEDMFITYSTFMGGTGTDYAQNMFERDSMLALVGLTQGPGFHPIKYNPGGYVDSIMTGFPFDEGDMFIVKMGYGQRLRHATLYGGTAWDIARCGAFDKYYNLYVGGYTKSLSGSFLPVSYLPAASHVEILGGEATFVLAFDQNNQKIWNTYYNYGDMFGMAATTDDKLFFNGMVDDPTDFPTLDWVTDTSYFDGTFNGSTSDAFMAMFNVVDFPNAIEEYNIEQIAASGIGVYPNPNDGNFNLVFNQDLEKANIQIFDNLGQVVYSEKPGFLAAKTPHPLNIGRLSTGMYYIYVSSVNSAQTAKFLIR